MYLQQLIQESQASIANWEAQIAELQAKILEMQEQIQMYGSVQSAMESADSLLINAVSLIKRVCPDELIGYRDLIVSRFDNPAAGELPPAPPAPTPDSPEPPAPNPASAPSPSTDDGAIEITAIEAEESHPEDPESPKDSTSNTPDDRVLSQQKIKSLEWSALRKLAKGCGINTKGMQRHEVEQALTAKRPTRDDLKRVA